MKQTEKIIFSIIFVLNIQFVKGQDNDRRYVGIEISTVSVKFTIINARKEVNTTNHLTYYVYDKVKEESDATKTHREDVIRNIAESVGKFYKIARKEYKIPIENIHICVSSAVVMQANQRDSAAIAEGKNSPTLDAIRNAVLEQVPEYNKAKGGCIVFLKDKQETYLTHIGVIRKEDRDKIALLEIGSAKMKGGYFNTNSKEMEAFELTLGTGSLTLAATKRVKNVSNFTQEYLAVLDTIINKERRDDIRTNVNNLRNKTVIVLNGGICWAVARLTEPTNKDAIQVITVEQVSNFIKNVSDKHQLEVFKSDTTLAPVFRSFNREQLIAGSILLKTVLEWIQGGSDKYEFYVYKDSYVAWLKGSIIAGFDGDNAFIQCMPSKSTK